jgi:hypothetical protein
MLKFMELYGAKGDALFGLAGIGINKLLLLIFLTVFNIEFIG